MVSKLIVQGKGSGKGKADVSLVAALQWRVLSANTPAALREMGHDRSATHVAHLQSRATTRTRDVGGFFVSLDGSAPPAKAHSLAAAFTGWMAEHPNALLCYALSSTDRFNLAQPIAEGAWLVVVVVSGLPVVDAVVSNADEASALIVPYLVSHPGISVVSNDTVRYPQTIKADNILPALVNYAMTSGDASTRLRPIPADTRKWVFLTVLLALAVAFGWTYQKSQREAERQRVLMERRNTDPALLYANALHLQAPHLGLARTGLMDAVDAVSRLPLRAHGWSLKSASCEATCSANYLRQSGLISNLKAAMSSLGPGYTLVAPLATETDLDKATVVVPASLDPSGPEPMAPTLQEFIQGKGGNQLQNWKTAGLSLQVQAPQIWPQAPGVPSTFKGEKALAVGAITVGGIALPLLKEVLGQAPPNVLWKGFKIEIATGSPSANPLDQATAQALGVFYIKP